MDGGSNNSVSDLFIEVRFSDSLHLAENSSGDLLRGEPLLLAIDVNFDLWLATLGDDLIR